MSEHAAFFNHILHLKYIKACFDVFVLLPTYKFRLKLDTIIVFFLKDHTNNNT